MKHSCVLLGILLFAPALVHAQSTLKQPAMSFRGVSEPGAPQASGQPVVTTHPRLLLTSTIKAQLLAKKNAGDPTWTALKSRADSLATYSIYPYIYANRWREPDNTIFYDYQGGGWFDATMPLALAFQMTGDTKFSNQLIALADEMIAAQSRPENNPPIGRPPLQPDSYYPTRYLGPVIAIIYDWCYDQLGSTRRTQMVALMNNYFDDLRANGYQANDPADGNYFVGHLIAAGYMGYASYGDNSRAHAMIDYARIRLDGTPSSLVDPSNVPESYFAQVFDGGYKSYLARGYNGPNITGAPFKGGFDFQGWAYGTGTFNHMIDYMQVIKTATGEDVFGAHQAWFSQILRAEKHALMPDHFQIDVAGDWGSDYGGVIFRSLPLRLASILSGTADGPGAEHFAYSEIADHSPYPDFSDEVYQGVFQPAEWESFYYSDPTRSSSELTQPTYYTGFAPNYPQGDPYATNGAIPYFIMRSDWGSNATWASLHMGAAYYDDHQHRDAGSFTIKHGNDFLLIDASNWKGALGSIGIVGSSTENDGAATANTLWFNDYSDFQSTYYSYYVQNDYGADEVTAAEQNDAYTYARGDLSTAYNRGSDPADQVGRKLEYFYRSFLYLRSASLFVVYDQVKAVVSSNSLGPYRKHLRWHFPSVPTIAGKTVSVNQGASRLFLDTLLPNNATLTAVDESQNQDPCDNGTIPNCTPYDAWSNNSSTYRVEVRDPNNPLSIPFLTVLQVGAAATPQMTTTNLTSSDGKMIGAQIVQPSGETNIVWFNNQLGKAPAPINTTSYSFSGPETAKHTMAGFVPDAKYAVTYSGGAINIVQDAGGNVTASPAGVLQFTLPSRYSAEILNLWPVNEATLGGTAKLWAQVKNVGSDSLPSNANVWFWVTGPNWSGSNWVGSTSVSGLASGATQWFSTNWRIPSSAATGTYQYWAIVWTETAISDWAGPQAFTVSGGSPGAATLVSPSGNISTSTPKFTWNAVTPATWYYLWVNDAASSPKIQQWYTAAQAGCASGTGTCSVTSPSVLAQGAAQWWIQTWNDAGYGPWSDAMSFTVSGSLPGAATLVSPSGTISTTNPTYTWNAVPNATWYYLWVNDGTGTKIATWYTAAQAGCASGTGTCSVIPSVALASGSAQWWIQTYNSAGYGPWSDGMVLTVPAAAVFLDRAAFVVASGTNLIVGSDDAPSGTRSSL